VHAEGSVDVADPGIGVEGDRPPLGPRTGGIRFAGGGQDRVRRVREWFGRQYLSFHFGKQGWLTKIEKATRISSCQQFNETIVFTGMKKRKRTYVLKARAEQLAETRARIVEAIMNLHQEVGPRHTTVSAIAKRAGVERLTVYRHFQDETEMFSACSHRYLELNPPPQQTAWANETDPVRRTRHGLEEVYAFFSRTAPMFEMIYRDVSEFPSLKAIMDQFGGYLRSLADDLVEAWPPDERRPARTMILRHATKFSTWQSLAAESATDDQKVGLMLAWLEVDPPPSRKNRSESSG